MDLVVNGPLKWGLREARIMGLEAEFKIVRELYKANDALPVAQQRTIKWSPPAPKMVDGLRATIATLASFDTPDFANGMKRAFIAVGLLPTAEGRYRVYTGAHGEGIKSPAVLTEVFVAHVPHKVEAGHILRDALAGDIEDHLEDPVFDLRDVPGAIYDEATGSWSVDV